MEQEGKIIEKLKQWAVKNDNVRAVVLTGSRANPGSYTDKFSDYDIELYVKDTGQFMDDAWLTDFGDVMIRWPLRPGPTFDREWITRLVLFENEMRIDFQITAKKSVDSSAFDGDYKVLVDKDGLITDSAAANLSRYMINKPTREEYEDLVNGFFWNATYVAKYLWRDELYYAKFMLDSLLRFEHLQNMIEWYIAVPQDWSVSTGKYGRFFKRYLNSITWAEVEATFSGAGIEDNWWAFFNMVNLFRRLAGDVADNLGYEYPYQIDQKVIRYCRKVKAMKRELRNGCKS